MEDETENLQQVELEDEEICHLRDFVISEEEEPLSELVCNE